MPTVADVLRRIERIKKDLEYVRGLQERWREQRERFPKIYEGIVEQERAFVQMIDGLRNLGVQSTDDLSASDDTTEEARPTLSPAIESSSNGGQRRRESSDDHRAAAESIDEKLRTRHGATAKSGKA